MARKQSCINKRNQVYWDIEYLTTVNIPICLFFSEDKLHTLDRPLSVRGLPLTFATDSKCACFPSTRRFDGGRYRMSAMRAPHHDRSSLLGLSKENQASNIHLPTYRDMREKSLMIPRLHGYPVPNHRVARPLHSTSWKSAIPFPVNLATVLPYPLKAHTTLPTSALEPDL